jgi:hypothetical protein
MRRHQVLSLIPVMATAVVKLNVCDVLMEVSFCLPAMVSKNGVTLIKAVSEKQYDTVLAGVKFNEI